MYFTQFRGKLVFTFVCVERRAAISEQSTCHYLIHETVTSTSFTAHPSMLHQFWRGTGCILEATKLILVCNRKSEMKFHGIVGILRKWWIPSAPRTILSSCKIHQFWTNTSIPLRIYGKAPLVYLILFSLNTMLLQFTAYTTSVWQYLLAVKIKYFSNEVAKSSWVSPYSLTNKQILEPTQNHQRIL